jgi:feruloyl esterase
MEAQRYPEDYDGIVAGAPFLSPTRQVPMMAWIQAQLNQPGAYISAEKLPAIAKATVKACDALDGVSDGVINDPRVCNFDPKVLLCQGNENDECLTAPQVKALKAIFSGPDPDGRAVEPGGELGIGSWSAWITGNKPGTSFHYRFASEFFRYLVYSDPTWSIDKFDIKLDGPAIYKALHKTLNADNPDLSRFAARGGKLIIFHGWNDPALPPTLSVEYYNSVRKHMGAANTDKFMRLYMVPGLQHCIGGPGANIFGQFLLGDPDPTVNINAAVQAWREKGREPEAIIATRYDKQLTALFAPEKATALRTRPLCPYPQRAVWDGKGSSDNAANFNCKAYRGAFPK